jgi:MFS family permease
MEDVSAAAPEAKTRSLDAFKEVLRNPNLRRIQLAWAGSNLGTWGYGVALSVFAYEHGGATAVGVVGLVRLIPAAIAAPFMGTLGDRHSRRLVMALSDLGRVVVVGLAALSVFLDLSPLLIYFLATVGVVISTAFRPAQAAILPSLAHSPHELTASNVVSSTIESLGMFAGPAVGGVILALWGTAAVFTVAAATFLWSAMLILRIHEPVGEEPGSGEEEAEEPVSFLRDTFSGFGTVAKSPQPRLLVGLFAAQTLVAGAMIVFEVVIALELLGRGDGWVGALLSAFGVGGVLGAVISGALVGRGRLALDFGTGLMLWGLPLILIAIWPTPVMALGTMLLMGIGNTLVDVSGMTLLQRSVPDELLARVFGVLETVFLATVALGSIVAPGLVSALGSRNSLYVIGAFLPVVLLLFGRKLLALDATLRAPKGELALLRGISFFEPLPQATQEHLARRLVPFTVPAGTRVFDQGDVGDRFYIVARGSVEIVIDGTPVTEVMAGGFFGEVALLREVPRQAGAVAREDTELLALEGEDFVSAVTGYSTSQEAAQNVMRSYGVGIGLPG